MITKASTHQSLWQGWWLYEHVTTTQHILTMKEKFDGVDNTLGIFNFVYTRMDSYKMLDNIMHEHDPKNHMLD